MATLLDVQSIQDSVRKGTLVELSSDYRTSATIRACLPGPFLCAMSTTAFHRHVLQRSAGEARSRLEAICAILGKVLKMGGEATRPWVEFKSLGKDGQPQSYPLKLEWFAPNRCWVFLLPDERLRTGLKPGSVTVASQDSGS